MMTAAMLFMALCLPLGASGAVEAAGTTSVLASTSWTAAFADLAGVDDVSALAPAELRHPPEYELTPSDIVRLQEADYFIAAGYERMMSTISEGVTSPDRVDIRINTGNDRANVIEQAQLIASYTGTTPRYDSYVAMLDEAASRVVAEGIDQLRVACHTMQTPLAEDLGLDIVHVFGGNELTPSDLDAAANGDWDLVIDNVHNPIAEPLAEVSGARYIVWRNFPEEVAPGALEATVRANLDQLFAD